MGNWGYRFMNFMRGRYGWDQLGMFLMIASFVIEILGRIFRSSIVVNTESARANTVPPST